MECKVPVRLDSIYACNFLVKFSRVGRRVNLTKIAQQIQLGTWRIWIQDIFLNLNVQKYPVILQTSMSVI